MLNYFTSNWKSAVALTTLFVAVVSFFFMVTTRCNDVKEQNQPIEYEISLNEEFLFRDFESEGKIGLIVIIKNNSSTNRVIENVKAYLINGTAKQNIGIWNLYFGYGDRGDLPYNVSANSSKKMFIEVITPYKVELNCDHNIFSNVGLRDAIRKISTMKETRIIDTTGNEIKEVEVIIEVNNADSTKFLLKFKN